MWDRVSEPPLPACVVKEALQLQPSTRPYASPQGHNQRHIPNGTNMLVNVWANARDLSVWKNLVEFCPECYLEDNIAMTGHDFQLLPFGAGRRACPEHKQVGLFKPK